MVLSMAVAVTVGLVVGKKKNEYTIIQVETAIPPHVPSILPTLSTSPTTTIERGGGTMLCKALR